MKKNLAILLTVSIMSGITFGGMVHAESTPAILHNIIDNDSRPEINISRDGLTTVRNAKVMQIAGTVLYTRLTWGDTFLRLTVKTTVDTAIYRRLGEKTTFSEISVGDYLNVEGQIELGGNSLGLYADNIVNIDVLKESTKLSGGVGALIDGHSFTLYSTQYGAVTVTVHPGTRIVKGNLSIALSELKKSDSILSAYGEYDHASKALLSDKIEVYVDMTQFAPRNYTEGKINKIMDGSKMRVTLEGRDYGLNLSDDTVYLNRARNTISGQRFLVGDSIRVYGATSEETPDVIDVEVIRNLDL